MAGREEAGGQRRWVLIVGISEYADEDRSLGSARYLPGVRQDAWLLKQLLSDSGDTPPHLLDVSFLPTPLRPATRQNILDELKRIAERSISSDQFVFYFGGHAHCVPGGDWPAEDGLTRYLLPSDATFQSAASNGISLKDLAEAVAQIRARQIIAILDCCHSAPIAQDWASLPALRGREYCIIASSEGESLELPDGGFLMRPLCQALEGTGVLLMEDGRVPLRAALDYAIRQAEREARDMEATFGRRFYQTVACYSGGRVLCLTRPRSTPAPLPLEAPLREIELRRPADQAFLIALVDEVRAEPAGQGTRLHVDVRDDQPGIYSSAGKEALFDRTAGMDHGPLAEFADLVERAAGGRYSSISLPLRWASGGVLPVIRHRGAAYFVLFFREVFPLGWNIANGASDNWDEMYQLRRLIAREFREELLIYNPAEGTVYSLDSPEHEYHDLAHRRRALELWGLGRSRAEPLPCAFRPGPDSARVTMLREGAVEICHETPGLYISVNPDELGIECTQVVEIQLPDCAELSRLAFLDGEIRSGDGTLKKQPIGLLEVEACRRWLAAGQMDDLPFAHFYEGRTCLPQGMRSSDRIRMYWANRNSLCAVTEKTIRRYLADTSPAA